MSNTAPRSNPLRFRLRSLLLFVVLVGIVAAWLTDRARLNSRLERSQLEIRILEDQIAAMQVRIAESLPTIAPPGSWGNNNNQWATADEFLDNMLALSLDDQEFFAMATPLAEVNKKVFHNVIERLTELLRASDKQSRAKALNMIRFMQTYRPDRMTQHSDSIVSAIIPLLSDPDENPEAIGTLESFGAKAHDAVEPLRSIMDDDDAWFAPAAAVAISRIDTNVEIGPRLEEFVTSHPDWYTAAFWLGESLEPQKARRILMKAYEDSEDKSKRRGLIQALNQIPVRPEP